MSKYNTISNFLFNNTTPVLLPVHRLYYIITQSVKIHSISC